MSAPPLQNATAEIEALADFIRRHPRLFVLTGAGISTESGIPDYRDENGAWKRKTPIMHQDFIDSESIRRRYWARSLLGWRYFGSARPGAAHHALADLEANGWVKQIVSQNVDGLHQQAGSQQVIDLHGRIDRLSCLDCGRGSARRDYQPRLEKANPEYAARSAQMAPDGDADLNLDNFDDFVIPPCDVCNGKLMPDVVFYGGSVPRSRVAAAYAALQNSDAVLVAGSSLMVYSGYRFCRDAQQWGIPIAAINLGRTRADDLFSLKLEQPCGEALSKLSGLLAS